MLEPIYRYAVYNGSGASVSNVTIREHRWKPGAGGARVFDGDTWATPLTGGGAANASLVATPTIDNTAFGAWHANLLVSVGGTGSSPCEIYVEFSPDGGTTWPDARKGIQIGWLVPGVSNKMMSV